MKSDNKSQVRLWMAMIGFTFSNVAMKFWQVRNRQIKPLSQDMMIFLFYAWLCFHGLLSIYGYLSQLEKMVHNQRLLSLANTLPGHR